MTTGWSNWSSGRMDRCGLRLVTRSSTPGPIRITSTFATVPAAWPWLAAAADGSLPDRTLAFGADKHVGIVLASEGYPAAGRTGVPIAGLDSAAALEDVIVFHSGTATRDGAVVTAGGRVLTVVGRGSTYERAIARAYEAVGRISFEGMQYRRDIGRKAVLVS